MVTARQSPVPIWSSLMKVVLVGKFLKPQQDHHDQDGGLPVPSAATETP